MSNSLDLHGVRHQDVDLLVENFILMNQDNFPLTVICGNSVRMIQIVESVISRIGCVTYPYMYGKFVIERFK